MAWKLFDAKDLWEVIDGTLERPYEEDEHHKEDFERWRGKNDDVLDVIHSCTLEPFSNIRGVSEAKGMAYSLLYPQTTATACSSSTRRLKLTP